MEFNFVYIVRREGKHRYYRASESLRILKGKSICKTTPSSFDFEPTKRQAKILELLKKHSKADTKKLSTSLKCSKPTVLRDLNVLISKKLILRYGSTKSAYYMLASVGEE